MVYAACGSCQYANKKSDTWNIYRIICVYIRFVRPLNSV